MKHQTLGAMSLLLAATAFAVTTLPARAQDATVTTPATPPLAAPIATPGDDQWKFAAAIPLWAPQVDGNVTVRGHQENVNVSFETLRNHLDAVFSLDLEARKNKFLFYTSVGYMKFSASGTVAGAVGASAGLKFLIYDAGAGYLLVNTGGDHPFLLEETVGLRYWYAATTIGVGAPVNFNGGQQYNLVDPVVGLRASQFITPKLHLDIAGDVGGFNISHNTDMTWSATGELTYDFARWFSLSAGYSALALDESVGSGVNQHGINLIFNGVQVTAEFKF